MSWSVNWSTVIPDVTVLVTMLPIKAVFELAGFAEIKASKFSHVSMLISEKCSRLKTGELFLTSV